MKKIFDTIIGFIKSKKQFILLIFAIAMLVAIWFFIRSDNEDSGDEQVTQTPNTEQSNSSSVSQAVSSSGVAVSSSAVTNDMSDIQKALYYREQTRAENQVLEERANDRANEIGNLPYEESKRMIVDYLNTHIYTKGKTEEELRQIGYNEAFIEQVIKDEVPRIKKQVYNLILEIGTAAPTIDYPTLLEQMSYHGYSEEVTMSELKNILTDAYRKRIHVNSRIQIFGLAYWESFDKPVYDEVYHRIEIEQQEEAKRKQLERELAKAEKNGEPAPEIIENAMEEEASHEPTVHKKREHKKSKSKKNKKS